VPENLSPPSASNALIVPEYQSDRSLVGGDYVVIQYNAKDNKTSWGDYNSFTGPIRFNGSFLPVIYTKEKVAVRVCGLHFTDVLTVTTAPTGVPEGGADIRGASVVTPPASLSSTLDTLQSGVPTGGTTQLPGLGLNAPSQLPSVTVSGITPGILGSEDQTPGKYPSYTPAQVTASGKQVALLLYSVKRNAQELCRLIDRTLGKPYELAWKTGATRNAPEAQAACETPQDAAETETDAMTGATGNAPGSVKGVSYILKKVLSQVREDAHDKTNSAAFDRHLTDIQNINAQISTLSGALSSQAFASNTIVLLNNYSALTGILDLAQLGANRTDCQNNQPSIQPANLSPADLKKLTFSDFANWTSSQVVSLTDAQLEQLSNKKDASDPTGKSVRDRAKALRAALKQLGITASGPTGDKPLCSVFETQRFADFWNSYSSQVAGVANNIDPAEFEGTVGLTLVKLNSKLNELRADLGEIDTLTTQLYDRMNEWYFKSSVEQTDLLPPLTTNALIRISIIVQRGYTPFTLANASGAITPAITANAVSTSVAAASTSTPAHAVKTILVEVHRVANFNLMGGVMLIHIPNASFAVQAAPTLAVADPTSPTGYTGTCAGQKGPVPPPASGSAPPTYSCIVQTQHSDWQVAGMAGVVWYPWGHDYFPRRSGYTSFGRNLLPSFLIATSVTSLGNSMGGVNWEPVAGLNFFAGVGNAHSTSLPSGLSVNTVVPTGTTINPVTHEHVGLTVGVGFDLNVITSLFSAKTSVASMP
jgi:hypothetical protein